MRRRLLLFSAGSMLLFTGAVSGQVPSGTSWIRVIHAVSDAPAVDVAANGNLVFQGLKFKDFSEYTPVPPGTYTIEVKLSGTDTTVITSGPLTLKCVTNRRYNNIPPTCRWPYVRNCCAFH